MCNNEKWKMLFLHCNNVAALILPKWETSYSFRMSFQRAMSCSPCSWMVEMAAMLKLEVRALLF